MKRSHQQILPSGQITFMEEVGASAVARAPSAKDLDAKGRNTSQLRPKISRSEKLSSTKVVKGLHPINNRYGALCE